MGARARKQWWWWRGVDAPRLKDLIHVLCDVFTVPCDAKSGDGSTQGHGVLSAWFLRVQWVGSNLPWRALRAVCGGRPVPARSSLRGYGHSALLASEPRSNHGVNGLKLLSPPPPRIEDIFFLRVKVQILRFSVKVFHTVTPFYYPFYFLYIRHINSHLRRNGVCRI